MCVSVGVCDFVCVGSERRGVLWEGVRGVKSDGVCVEGKVLCVRVWGGNRRR